MDLNFDENTGFEYEQVPEILYSKQKELVAKQRRGEKLTPMESAQLKKAWMLNKIIREDVTRIQEREIWNFIVLSGDN